MPFKMAKIGLNPAKIQVMMMQIRINADGNMSTSASEIWNYPLKILDASRVQWEKPSVHGFTELIGVSSIYGDKMAQSKPDWDEIFERYLHELYFKTQSKEDLDEFIRNCLDDLGRDARQEGIEIEKEVRDEAERILRQYPRFPDDTEIYAEDGGIVAIAVNRNPHGGFLLHCEPSREALCVVVVEGVSRRARYRDSSILPDGFLREGLRDVLRQSAH